MCPLEDSNSTDSNDSSIIRVGGSSLSSLADVEQKTTGQYGLHVIAGSDLASSNSSLDAFGRLRISNPETIFETTFRWDKQPVTWCEQLTSGGTVTHDANKVSVVLACTTTTNSEAIFQSRRYVHYHPAKSHLICVSGNFIATATNVIKQLGYFDDDNGVFFQLSGSTLSVVRRTKTSGSVVDNTTNQASWSIDKFDGTGVSGLTIDVTKQQLFIIDFQWLGSGRIRYGFVVNGKILYCHEDNAANILTLPWSQTGDAPVRARIKNTSATAASMHITCASVICENSYNPEGIIRTVNNSVTSRNIGASGSTVPLLSIRKQSAFANVGIQIVDCGLFGSTTDDYLMTLIYNGTLTGASFASVSGVCQLDVSATAISGGTSIYSIYVQNGASSVILAEALQNEINLQLGRDIAGASDVFSVVATAVTDTSKAHGFINYRELL